MRISISLFIIVLFVACAGRLAADVYASALSSIATGLDAQIYLVQLTLSVYMLGVALSLLVYGPLSDAFGRKGPLLGGMYIMLVGSFICLVAPTVTILLVGRFIQGAGAGACTGLWRSIFRDLFSGEELARIGSYFAIGVMAVIPVAPALGSYMDHYLGWRSVFVLIAVYVAVVLVSALWKLPETSRHHHKDHLKLRFIFQSYKHLFTSRVFMGMTAAMFLTYGAFFSWFTAGPILLADQLHLSPVVFGQFSLVAGFSMMGLGALVNVKFVKRVGMTTMMQTGWSIVIVSGLSLLLAYENFGLNFWAIVLPIVSLYFGTALVWPSAFATAMEPFGETAGYAGAMYSFMQISGGAVMAAIVAYLPENSPVPLALVFVGCALAAIVVYELAVRRVMASSATANH